MEVKGKIKTIDEYFNTEGISSSLLKKYLYPPFNEKKEEDTKYYKEKKFLEIGSMVDILLTLEDGSFEKLYYIVEKEFKKPSSNIVSIVKYAYDKGVNSLTDEYGIEAITAEASSIDYGQSWKTKTLIDKVVKEGEQYFNFLKESEGKYCVDKDEYDKVLKHYQQLRHGKYTADFFENLPEGLIVLNQVDIYLSTKRKGLIDRLYINTTDKPIKIGNHVFKAKSLTVCDIKTTSFSLHSFEDVCRKLHYPLQVDYYTSLIESFLENNDNQCSALEELKLNKKEFRVTSPIILASSIVGGSFCYSFSQHTLEVARYGSHVTREGVSRKKPIAGWINALSNYAAYKKKDFVLIPHLKDNKLDLYAR